MLNLPGAAKCECCPSGTGCNSDDCEAFCPATLTLSVTGIPALDAGTCNTCAGGGGTLTVYHDANVAIEINRTSGCSYQGSVPVSAITNCPTSWCGGVSTGVAYYIGELVCLGPSVDDEYRYRVSFGYRSTHHCSNTNCCTPCPPTGSTTVGMIWESPLMDINDFKCPDEITTWTQVAGASASLDVT